MKVNVEILSGPLDGEAFHFSRSIDIGRDETCEIPIQVDRFISRRHARILVVAGECFLEDLGSTNGTFVKDTRLKKRVELDNEEIFRVGKTWMQISW